MALTASAIIVLSWLAAYQMAKTIRDIAPSLKYVRKILVVLYGDEAYRKFEEVFKKVLS